MAGWRSARNKLVDSPAMDPHRGTKRPPPDALRQIHAELRTDLPDWNFEVGNPAAPPTELKLDETTRNDLELRVETVRSILKKPVGGSH